MWEGDPLVEAIVATLTAISTVPTLFLLALDGGALIRRYFKGRKNKGQ